MGLGNARVGADQARCLQSLSNSPRRSCQRSSGPKAQRARPLLRFQTSTGENSGRPTRKPNRSDLFDEVAVGQPDPRPVETLRPASTCGDPSDEGQGGSAQSELMSDAASTNQELHSAASLELTAQSSAARTSARCGGRRDGAVVIDATSGRAMSQARASAPVVVSRPSAAARSRSRAPCRAGDTESR